MSSSRAETSVGARRIEHQDSCITYAELSIIRDRSYRNGNWSKLTKIEKALYKASLGLARLRGKLVNTSLLRVLRGIIDKLLRSFDDLILELGLRKAESLKELCCRKGVFHWLPLLEVLLNEKEYILWLGNKELTLKDIGNV